MTVALAIENLSKRYQVNRIAGRPEYHTLREAMSSLIAAPWRRMIGHLATGFEEFWALRNVTLDIAAGETVGIIGGNGAGKSTLLKIISRITAPTSGRVRLRGRVASLLEVGTGFHPELTGRENIFLNGAILGMSRREIKRQFDSIVEFSGVERFLDTPIKRYSSGMKVRLAFSVAAHLEPEILIVDEVLAVGDAAFQKKCLGKMSEVASSGQTVLFVSHNMAAVENLCERVVLLKNGAIQATGNYQDVIAVYLGSANQSLTEDLSGARVAGMSPVIQSVKLVGAAGEVTTTVPAGGACSIEIGYELNQPLVHPRFGIQCETITGERLFLLQTGIQGEPLPSLIERRGVVRCDIPELPLVPGMYTLSIGCASRGQQVDLLERAVQFDVVHGDYFGTGRLPSAIHGHLLLQATWRLGE